MKILFILFLFTIVTPSESHATRETCCKIVICTTVTALILSVTALIFSTIDCKFHTFGLLCVKDPVPIYQCPWIQYCATNISTLPNALMAAFSNDYIASGNCSIANINSADSWTKFQNNANATQLALLSGVGNLFLYGNFTVPLALVMNFLIYCAQCIGIEKIIDFNRSIALIINGNYQIQPYGCAYKADLQPPKIYCNGLADTATLTKQIVS